MPLLGPTNQMRNRTIRNRRNAVKRLETYFEDVRPLSFAIASQEVQLRTAQVTSQWTSQQRTERKRLGAAKQAWLLQLMESSPTDQE